MNSDLCEEQLKKIKSNKYNMCLPSIRILMLGTGILLEDLCCIMDNLEIDRDCFTSVLPLCVFDKLWISIVAGLSGVV